jgi:hypothetical protein
MLKTFDRVLDVGSLKRPTPWTMVPTETQQRTSEVEDSGYTGHEELDRD